MGYFYAALVGYVFGSLPFAYWFGLLQNKNMLAEGSGNVGAKNAWRVLGAVPGLMVLILDIAKGLMAVALGGFLAKDPNGGLLAGALAVWGHCFSMLLLGRGGKGIATTIGVMLAIQPPILIGSAMLFALAYLLSRHTYRAVFTTALILPILTVAIGQALPYLLFGFGVGIPVALRHWGEWNRVDRAQTKT
jgi:glycerol-3-phosphate acyltransferase PlsY